MVCQGKKVLIALILLRFALGHHLLDSSHHLGLAVRGGDSLGGRLQPLLHFSVIEQLLNGVHQLLVSEAVRLQANSVAFLRQSLGIVILVSEQREYNLWLSKAESLSGGVADGTTKNKE